MYLLDANTCIEAKNVHYQMSFCPGYWDWLDIHFASGTIASISTVYDELSVLGDELSTWVKKRQGYFIPVTDIDIQSNFALIAQYVYELKAEGKRIEHITQFLSGADPWLIATALTKNATIVTHEVLAPINSYKVKIPNICQTFGIKCIRTYDLLLKLEAKLIIS